MLTPLQKTTAQAIVNIFETGKPLGDYGRVTLLPGDTGGLTFGRSQTTLASGNLYKLVNAYCISESAQFAEPLRPYLERLREKDAELNSDRAIRQALKKTGDDPAMRDVQDAFFDKAYWNPAQKAADSLAIADPLGVAVIYDSKIHGSWARISNKVITNVGNPQSFGERPWIEAYVNERRNWLANHTNTLLRKTVYRMDAFRELIAQNRWALDLPLTVRGIAIEQATLMPQAPQV
jgi:chitosanase